VKVELRNPLWMLGLVVLWRAALWAFTGQPIQAADSFGYDGGVVNWLLHGHYCNPSLAIAFPISGREVFSMYPPGYQAFLLGWMSVFGVSALAQAAFHITLVSLASLLTVLIARRFFPTVSALPVLLLVGFTFTDRPEDVAHIWGLAAVWLVMRQVVTPNAGMAGALWAAVCLFLALYTSALVGAFYFAVGGVTCALVWLERRKLALFIPFIVSTLLFIGVTILIIKLKPLWWQGFLENGHKQPVMSGFHAPKGVEVLKLVRNVPFFLVGFLMIPLVWQRWRQVEPADRSWLYLLAGLFVASWGLLVADMVLLAPNYIFFTVYMQVLLAMGMVAWVAKYMPVYQRLLRICLLGCVLLVSVRAVGMSTWGGMCAWKNSYWQTRMELQTEFAPFTQTNTPVVVSSVFLYQAAQQGVTQPIHTDWYYDRAEETAPDADLAAMARLRPARLFLTQYDYYRSFIVVVGKLKQHPELARVVVRDLAKVRTPDSIPSLQRVVQHISWAPVIVELDWLPIVNTNAAP
jgi:uncharacterized membrane protein